MDMEMVHGLTTLLAVIDDDPVPIREPVRTRNLSGGPQKMTEQCPIIFCGGCKRIDVPAWRDQDMRRRLRMNIRECVTLLILVDGLGWNRSFNDFAEEATHDVHSVQEGAQLAGPAYTGRR
jgi:hypothetical protein